MINSTKPQAKSEGLVIQELAGETLVYDLKANKAHCLNETSGFVWQNCDGSKTSDDIRGEMEKHSGKEVQIEIVDLAIRQLTANNLLLGDSKGPDNGISRRSLIKKAGFTAAVALPIVASIAVPSNALAASSAAAPGSPCTAPVDCANGACLGSPGTCL